MQHKPTNAPKDYDQGVVKTIPLYDELHLQVLGLTGHGGLEPRAWLEAGCGTGTFAEKAAARYPGAELSLIDPMEDMLAVTRERLHGNPSIKDIRLAGSENADYPDASFDIATAILSHHYFQPDARRRAVENIFRMLKPGGMFVTIEHVAPLTERGLEIALARWRDFQIESGGKTFEKAAQHVARYGQEYFPITVDSHLALLRESGFAVAELFWFSYGQAGVYGIKAG